MNLEQITAQYERNLDNIAEGIISKMIKYKDNSKEIREKISNERQDILKNTKSLKEQYAIFDHHTYNQFYNSCIEANKKEVGFRIYHSGSWTGWFMATFFPTMLGGMAAMSSVSNSFGTVLLGGVAGLITSSVAGYHLGKISGKKKLKKKFMENIQEIKMEYFEKLKIIIND